MLLSLFALTGCSITAVPVTLKFPEAPATLLEKCAALKEVHERASLTEFTKIVVENYLSAQECSRKVEGWHEWYTKQKAIVDEATKK
jgi:hypothetical protein